jgi:hypothetical protein
MAGWSIIQKIRSLEEKADRLGMKFAPYRHANHYSENVALIPKDSHALPIYCRDAELFAGSLEAAEYFMRGIEWARDYDCMVIAKDMDKKRERKEQDERNRILLRTLKDGKVPNLVKT